jgi:N-acetylglucosaminyldiphosphoundecaprenol N-acetyl-beta-D-mannosaminyltransferase
VVAAARDHSARRYACVFAVDSLLKCRDNPELAATANESDWTFCDGMPLVLLGKRVAKLPVSRCYGPDLMLDVCDRGRAVGLRHFFYGGTDEETIRLLSRNLQDRFPGLQIAGSIVPPFRPLTDEEERDTVRTINEADPDIVWIGIGTPKQDFWARRMRPKLNAPVLVAVGAAFNFHAGKVSQAPRWMQRSCLEWLYRLFAEPRRLWRRYLIGNPRFLLLVLRQWLTGTPGGRLCETA